MVHWIKVNLVVLYVPNILELFSTCFPTIVSQCCSFCWCYDERFCWNTRYVRIYSKQKNTQVINCLKNNLQALLQVWSHWWTASQPNHTRHKHAIVLRTKPLSPPSASHRTSIWNEEAFSESGSLSGQSGRKKQGQKPSSCLCWRWK